MDVIPNKNKNVAHLKMAVISNYVRELKAELTINKNVLKDKNWASSGSDFHNECRADMDKEIKEIERQIKVLSPKH